MTAPTPLIAGNWKMNGTLSSLDEARAVAAGFSGVRGRVVICPPATLIRPMVEALTGSAVSVGAQDCHSEPSGAFTGDLSAEMLAEAGARMVILGHSERRAVYGETDDQVAAKARGAIRAALEPIVCVGETLSQRNANDALKVVTQQVRGSLPRELEGRPYSVAYEPVWAIGTGLTPTLDQIEEMHAAIRTTLQSLFGEAGNATPILYGGSVKPSNATEILHAANVGGALVGGASLKAMDFLSIIGAL